MKTTGNKTRVSLEEAKVIKGKSNYSKLLIEQRKELSKSDQAAGIFTPNLSKKR